MSSEPGDQRLRDAYAHCLRLAGEHYENFPVASHALPPRLRAPVAVIYAFARTADDYADEGEHSPEERLALLAAWRRRVDALAADDVGDDPASGNAEEAGRRRDDAPANREAGNDHPVFIALADVRARHGLPLAPLYDLLDAFTQDVTRRRYQDEADLLDYCRRSANPVGRLLLHLFGQTEDRDLAQSDDICTALQLINFLQDLSQDYEESGRIYLPLDEMTACGVDETHFAQRRTDEAMRKLIAIQATRARRLLDRGAPLAWRLRGRVGLELRLIVTAAGRVLDRIAAEREDVFRRPRLQRSDWPAILWQTVRGPKPQGSDPGNGR